MPILRGTRIGPQSGSCWNRLRCFDGVGEVSAGRDSGRLPFLQVAPRRPDMRGGAQSGVEARLAHAGSHAVPHGTRMLAGTKAGAMLAEGQAHRADGGSLGSAGLSGPDLRPAAQPERSGPAGVLTRPGNGSCRRHESSAGSVGWSAGAPASPDPAADTGTPGTTRAAARTTAGPAAAAPDPARNARSIGPVAPGTGHALVRVGGGPAGGAGYTVESHQVAGTVQRRVLVGRRPPSA